MKLLVDFGNSRVKWAWLVGAELRDPGALVHAGIGIGTLVARILAGRRAEEVRLASVAAGGVTAELDMALQHAARAPVHVACTRSAAAGVRNGYHEPRQLGVDRWLALVAAYTRYRSAVCVVDAGTAWTVDVVEADGEHLGGFIVPGPMLMRQALVGATGRIAPAAGLLPDPVDAGEAWGRDTEACMRKGARRAGVSLVESCWKAFGARDGTTPVLVLTGGDAGELRPLLSVPSEHRPLLVLEGLALPGMAGPDRVCAGPDR